MRISPVSPQELMGRSQWVRPKAWSLEWELRKDGRVYAIMSPPRLFGTAIAATLGEEAFALRKGGLRRPGAAIRRSPEEADLALLSFDAIGKGTITFADSSTYAFERTGSEEEWTVSQEGRGAIFVLQRDTLSKYPSGQVSVDIADPRLGVLLLLTWFVITTSDC